MSDLARKLAEAVTEEGDECLRRQIASFLERFQVNDLLCNTQNLKVVLLCESPHTDETSDDNIEKRHPLAGDSGKKVTKMLWKHVLCKDQSTMPDKAIGELVKKKNSCFKYLGIMNASTLPLGLAPYVCSPPRPFCDVTPLIRILDDFHDIKDPKKSTVPNDGVGRVIRDDLLFRLEKIPNKALFVLCGNTAQKCFKAAVSEDEYATYKPVCVPHPSYGHWSDKNWKEDEECRTEHEKQLRCMCEKIREKIRGQK